MITSLTSHRDNLTLRIVVIVVLAVILTLLIFVPGKNWNEGPAPTATGKVISITPATPQEKAQDSTRLGTILVQQADGYQLLLRVKHATGDGCQGNSTLHLSDITVGETVTTHYWLDNPDSSSNPHKGSAVYINDRC